MAHTGNWRGKLQEYAMKNSLPTPVYKADREGGEDHNPRWICNLTWGQHQAHASSSSKKKAKQLAAEAMFGRIRAVTYSTEVPISHEPDNVWYVAGPDHPGFSVVILAEVTSYPRFREIRARPGVKFYGFADVPKDKVDDSQCSASTEIHIVRNKLELINSIFFYLGKHSFAQKLILASHVFVTSPELTETVKKLHPKIILQNNLPVGHLHVY